MLARSRRRAGYGNRIRARLRYLCDAPTLRLLVGCLDRGVRERSQIVGRLRCFARGGEDRAVIVPQQVEPIGDVTGVPQLAFDAEVGTEESGGELRDQFLGGVGAGAEAAGEIAVEAGLVSRPMTVMPLSA